MSLCFRSLSGRLSSLVSSRKPLSKLDRHQLRKQIESSSFLNHFLGTQRALSVRANVADKPSVPFVSYPLHPNVLLTSPKICSQSNEKQIWQYIDDKSKNTTIKWTQGLHRPHNRPQKLSLILSKNKKHLASIGLTSENVTVFRTQSIVRNDKNNSFLDNSRTISSESSHSSRKLNTDKGILLTSDDSSTLKRNPLPQQENNDGKPSQDQLQNIVDCLSQDVCHMIYRLPKLFVKPLDYSIYTKNIIFINNIRGETISGIMNYARHMIILRTIGHLRFAHVKFDVIKVTMHTEDGTVKVRWRIRGVSGWKVVRSFWKYKFWNIQGIIDRDHETWYDGFSTYYLNGDGKVYKHVADKMMPDQDMVAKKENLGITPKLALFTGLTKIFDSNEDFFKLNSNLKLHEFK